LRAATWEAPLGAASLADKDDIVNLVAQ
jgi:hypothetical protein